MPERVGISRDEDRKLPSIAFVPKGVTGIVDATRASRSNGSGATETARVRRLRRAPLPTRERRDLRAQLRLDLLAVAVVFARRLVHAFEHGLDLVDGARQRVDRTVVEPADRQTPEELHRAQRRDLAARHRAGKPAREETAHD